MDESMLTIEFRLVDENGYEYSSSSKVPVFESLGETSLDIIGEQLNIFLKQCGYYRKNDNILMEDLSDEEYDAIVDFLSDYRENIKNLIEYNGYHAKIEISEADGCFVGSVIGIKDSLNFHGSNLSELKEAFKSCIDNYIKMCKEFG